MEQIKDNEMRIQEHARSTQLRGESGKSAADRFKTDSQFQILEQDSSSVDGHVKKIKLAGELRGAAEPGDEEDSAKPVSSDAEGDNTSRKRMTNSSPKSAGLRRRRGLLNKTALDKLSAVKREATGREAASESEQRRPRPPSPSFAERVAHEQKLLSLREKSSSYTDCSPLVDDDDPDGSNDRRMCSKATIHVSMSIDAEYIRGATALINSILKNASCPQHVFFHFMTTASEHESAGARVDDVDENSDDTKTRGELDDPMDTVRYYFPFIQYMVYVVDQETLSENVRKMHTRSDDLENPLNYSRIVLPLLLPECVEKIIYLDTDMVVVGRIEEL